MEQICIVLTLHFSYYYIVVVVRNVKKYITYLQVQHTVYFKRCSEMLTTYLAIFGEYRSQLIGIPQAIEEMHAVPAVHLLSQFNTV